MKLLNKLRSVLSRKARLERALYVAKQERLLHTALSELEVWLTAKENPVIDFAVFPFPDLLQRLEDDINSVLTDRCISWFRRWYWRHRAKTDIGAAAEKWLQARAKEEEQYAENVTAWRSDFDKRRTEDIAHTFRAILTKRRWEQRNQMDERK